MESVPERLVGSSAVVSVDVVTVTYRSAGTVRGALERLTGREGVRVIVVDNASDDATLDVLAALPVETIALDENGGFAHGCNVGAAAGNAPYVLFLNPDALLEPEACRSSSALEDERVGAALPGSSSPTERSTTLCAGSRAWLDVRAGAVPPPPVPDGDLGRRGDPRAVGVRAAQRSSGSQVRALLVRRTVLEQIGGLDESFFHYSEDMDICARIWKAG